MRVYDVLGQSLILNTIWPSLQSFMKFEPLPFLSFESWMHDSAGVNGP
jgi:hypothetical protein